MKKLMIVLGGLLVALMGLAVAVVLLVDPDDYRDEIAARASSTLGREVRLDGPISLRLFPWVALDIRDVRVGNPAGFDDAPDLGRVGQVAVEVRLLPLLRGELEIGTVSLSDAELVIVTDRHGQTNLDGLLGAEHAAVDAPAAPDLSRLSLGRLELQQVQFEQLDLASGERLGARIERLSLDPFQAGQFVPLKLRAVIEDADGLLIDALELDGQLRVAADLSSVALSNWQASLALPAADARVRAEGDVEALLDGPMPVLQLARMNAQVQVAGQDLGFELTRALRLVLDDKPSVQLEAARLFVNGQRLDLAGSLVLGEPIRADLQLSGDRLDLRPLLLDDRGSDAGIAGSAPDFSALVGPDLRLTVDLEELVLSDQLRLDAVAGRARLADGQLRLDPLEAGLFGGHFSGGVDVDLTVSPPRSRISPRLGGIQVQQVAGLLSHAAPLRGVGEMDLEFKFSGLTAAEILASLDGQGSFGLDDGALLGVDLRRLVEERLTVSALSNVNEVFAGETPFRSLSGSLRAESGVVFLPDLRLSAADFAAAGQGRLDFAQGEIAYRLDLSLDEALLAQMPPQLVRATGGVIPLSISGPLLRPSVQVDLRSIAEGVAQRELQDRLLERLRPPDDKPPADSVADPDTETSDGERRERTRDVLMRGLLQRQGSERQEPPAEQDETEPEEESEPNPKS